MTHVMLFAHRYYFENLCNCNEKLSKDEMLLGDIFTELGVSVTGGELKAFMNYFHSAT